MWILVRKNEMEPPKPKILEFIINEDDLKETKERLRDIRLKSYVIYEIKQVFLASTVRQGKKRKRLIFDASDLQHLPKARFA